MMRMLVKHTDNCACGKGKGVYMIFLACVYSTMPLPKNCMDLAMREEWTSPTLPLRLSRTQNSDSQLKASCVLAMGPRAICSMRISASDMPPMTDSGRDPLYLVRSSEDRSAPVNRSSLTQNGAS